MFWNKTCLNKLWTIFSRWRGWNTIVWRSGTSPTDDRNQDEEPEDKKSFGSRSRKEKTLALPWCDNIFPPTMLFSLVLLFEIKLFRWPPDAMFLNLTLVQQLAKVLSISLKGMLSNSGSKWNQHKHHSIIQQPVKLAEARTNSNEVWWWNVP